LARLLAEVREDGLVLERGVDFVEKSVDLLDDVR
jgi:hypothetical protein